MIVAAHASDAFNRTMSATLIQLADDLSRAIGSGLTAIILGGGYGRGEGAVIGPPGDERPYNDLDLFIVVTRVAGNWRQRVHPVCELASRRWGIEIDIGRPLTCEAIARWPASQMWKELLEGHLVLWGPSEVLSVAPPHVRGPLPAVEASRLLLNRGAGLLWALRVLHGFESAPDADFLRRNYFKALLACGDAVLISHGMHQSAYTGRDRHLAALAAQEPTVAPLAANRHYAAALTFKLWPNRLDAWGNLGSVTTWTPEQRQRADADLREAVGVWTQTLLHVEGRRLGRIGETELATWQDYAAWPGLYEPQEHSWAGVLRNLLRQARRGRFGWRHPREALYRTLASLLHAAPALVVARSDNPTSTDRFIAGGDEQSSWAARAGRWLEAWRAG